MSLRNALFTDSQAKVYQWIFGDPARAYHVNELRRLTGLGSASLQREINRLVDAGLATSVMVGNQRRPSKTQPGGIRGVPEDRGASNRRIEAVGSTIDCRRK